MKKSLLLLLSLAALISACQQKPASFKVTTKNFGKNAVIGIYGASNGEVYKMENITNADQHIKINIPTKGYAALRTKDGQEENEYWLYLDGGEYTLNLNADSSFIYPIKTSESKEEQELIEYYKIKDVMSKTLNDSLVKAHTEMDNSTRANVLSAAKNLDVWMEKKTVLDLDIIKTFGQKFPNSPHTVFLLDMLGRVDADSKIYRSIFNNLSSEVKESKAGKKLLNEINQASQMMAGSKMPNIEGESPAGIKFNPKILKKVNLVICWTSYSWKSRENNKILVNLYKEYKDQNVEFISVSLDKKKNWWLNVIKEDQLTWPQFSDLKGEKSPNAKNLSNYNITYFFLVDQNGNVLSNNDLTIDFVSDEIAKALRETK